MERRSLALGDGGNEHRAPGVERDLVQWCGDLLEARTYPVDERGEGVEVESVDLGDIAGEHGSDFVLWHVGEHVPERLNGVWERALPMGEVVSPHDAVDADLVPHLALGQP